jgi:DNA-binding response OmpR family regulator
MPEDQHPPAFQPSALLYETERAVIRTLTLQLQDRNWEVYSAREPHKALSLLDEHHPAVALLDMINPEMDGIELARKMRAISPDLIIILLTGYPEPDLAVEDLHQLVFTYLVKPVRIDQLLLVIARAQQGLAVLQENRLLKQQAEQLRLELEQAHQAMETTGAGGSATEDESLSLHRPLGRGPGGVPGRQPNVIASYERQMSTAKLDQRPEPEPPPVSESAPAVEQTEEDGTKEQQTDENED